MVTKANRFFALCEKCGSKQYQHQGYKESPAGRFTFTIKCHKCKDMFKWVFVTREYREQQDKIMKETVFGNLGELIQKSQMALKRQLEVME